MKQIFFQILFFLFFSAEVFTQSVQNNRIGFEIIGDRKKAEFQFENYNNLIIVPVMINGVIPVKFILDTGVSNAILTETSVSDFLSINYDRKVPLMGADGSKVINAYVASDVSLKLPGVDSRGQGVLVLAEDYLQLKNYLGVEVHGIIGYDLFSRFVVKINYDRKTLTLYDPKRFKPKKKLQGFPMSIEDTKPFLNAEVTFANGKTIETKMLMDTGASHSVLINKRSHPEIEIPEPTIEGILGRGLGGDIFGQIGRVKKVNLFDFEFENVIGSFPNDSSTANIFLQNERQGTIGGGILSKFTVTVDYGGKMIYLQKGKKYREKFEYNMSGIEPKAVGDDLNYFVIHDVRKNSAADEIDLRPGDELISINGQSTRDLKLNDINAFFRSKEGKKIKIVIIRNNVRIRKTLKLKKII